MSYIGETDTNINDDILTRKEFRLFSKSLDAIKFKTDMEEADAAKKIIPKFLIKNNIPAGNYLELRSYQLFVRNYFNPNTPYSRMLIKWETGLGKTVGSMSIAMNFINFYQKHEEYTSNEVIGSVFVIGFTQQIFKDELFKYAEFGFISRSEIEKLKKLKKQANEGSIHDKDNLKKFNIMLRKRLYNRKGNGFFKFIGYKELSNHLFKLREADKSNIQSMTEKELQDSIESGNVTINMELLETFSNSLLICDEIHNVYNSLEKNNWGVTLQTILNYHKSCRAIFLSATPINNSPTEVIDLLNLLLPREHYPMLNKNDFFTKDGNLIKSKEALLHTFFKGRISFIRNRNPKYMATRSILGTSIPGIDYIKFIRCPMSKFHYKTYKSAIEVFPNLGQEGMYLLDFALPDPTHKKPFSELGIYKSREIKGKLSLASGEWKSSTGIYYNSKKDIISGHALSINENLGDISSKYTKMIETVHNIIRSKKGKIFIYHNVIHVSGTLFIQETLRHNNIIGEFDNSSDDTMCSVCGKLRKVHTDKQLTHGGRIQFEDRYILFSRDLDELNLDELYSTHKSFQVMIEVDPKDQEYIDFFINKYESHKAENGYLYFYNHGHFDDKDEVEEYIKKIYVYIKNQTRGGTPEHHFFKPARFVIIHSNLDRKIITQSMEKFNHINNIDGTKFMILIGSKIIKESHSMNSVRNIMIMSRPDNIPTMVQIIGRTVRLGSHNMLPPNERHVDIRIFTSTTPDGKISREEERYKEKINTYKIIQNIEKGMHENAIDAYFNYSTIWNAAKEEYGLSILPYELPKKILSQQELNMSTFNAYHASEEVNYIRYMIKRLFLELSPAWRYTDLFNAIKLPPFEVEINTDLVSQNIFNIALNTLIYNKSLNYTEPIIQSMNDDLINSNLLDRMRNPEERVIKEINGIKYVISHVGEFYMMCPLNPDNTIVLDAEALYRIRMKKKVKILNIQDYLQYDINTNFADKKIRFIKKWETVSIHHLEQALCDFGVKFHQDLIEEINEYVFNIWTNPNIKKNEYHGFYLKMLYYYDLRKLIAWAHTVDDSMKKLYSKYVKPVNVQLLDKTLEDTNKELKSESSGIINLLISSINKSRQDWISTGMIKEYEDKLRLTNSIFDGIYRKSKQINKINADLLPVGHFFSKIPRFYNPELKSWVDNAMYSEKSSTTKENNIIIGYEERSKTGISVKFKIRNPIQNIKKYRDNRLIEKGAICTTKSKSYLKNIAKKLDIDIKDINQVEALCQKIRSKLIYNELKERIKNSPTRWFYFVYENSI